MFKTRHGSRAAGKTVKPQPESASGLEITAQTMDVSISSNSALFLLPDPVTCFRSASYNQIQTFRLSEDSSSVALLDWVTSGRKSLGEEWVFSRYYSVNEVWVGGKRVARDVLLLEDTDKAVESLPKRTLADRLAPYSCYATLILYGPQVQGVIRDIKSEYASISVYKARAPTHLIWSMSPISNGKGCVVRIAGKDTESVRQWLRNALKMLEAVVGIDVYRRAFPP